MLRQLRLYEEIVLYASIPGVSPQEEIEAKAFLKEEYQREAIAFQHEVPPFSEEAAFWAAALIYRAAQLMLYRENKEVELAGILPVYNGPKDVSAILSADLTLRFLPSVIEKLKEIDKDDALIPLLSDVAVEWDFSSVGMKMDSKFEAMRMAKLNPCLLRLYIDRVIELRDAERAQHPLLHEEIKAVLGLYTSELWPGFEMLKLNTEV